MSAVRDGGCIASCCDLLVLESSLLAYVSSLFLVAARKITATGELRGQNRADTPTRVISTSSEQPPLLFMPVTT